MAAAGSQWRSPSRSRCRSSSYYFVGAEASSSGRSTPSWWYRAQAENKLIQGGSSGGPSARTRSFRANSTAKSGRLRRQYPPDRCCRNATQIPPFQRQRPGMSTADGPSHGRAPWHKRETAYMDALTNGTVACGSYTLRMSCLPLNNRDTCGRSRARPSRSAVQLKARPLGATGLGRSCAPLRWILTLVGSWPWSRLAAWRWPRMATRRVLRHTARRGHVATAQMIGETDDLSQRLEIREDDEVGQLLPGASMRCSGERPGDLARRSSTPGGHGARRQLVADARTSRELRTPVTTACARTLRCC